MQDSEFATLKTRNVHYGCGLDAPISWENFDVSPTLRIQKIPLLGHLATRYFHNVDFPEHVRYGDIVKGLPNIQENSCGAVYCSHTLEHLSLADFRIALKNTFTMLVPGGIFRCVVPDLEFAARKYVSALDSVDSSTSIASYAFLNETLLGKKVRPRGLKAAAQLMLGNSNHLWMWDHFSLGNEIRNVGFSDVRNAVFNDSENGAFIEVENKARFQNAVAIEARK